MSGLTGYLLQDGITDLSNVFLGKSSIVNISGNNTFTGTNTFNGIVKMVDLSGQLQLSSGATITTSTTLSSPLAFFYVINTGNITITLPTPSTTNAGSMIVFKRLVSGTTTYNVTGAGTLIYALSGTSPLSSLGLATLNVQFICNGTYWFVIHSV
jgi:hypothetical protein